MSTRAQWILALVGLALSIVGIIAFAATQTVTGRDLFALVFGAVFGATAAACISVWQFHSSDRANRKAAEIKSAELSAAADVEREAVAAAARQTLEREAAEAERDAIRTRAAADAAAVQTLAAAQAALIEKRASLLSTLPTRQERLAELHKAIGLARQNINSANGHADAEDFKAREATRLGLRDEAHEHQALAKNWRINVEEFTRRLPDLEAERDRLEGMNDDEYRTLQAQQRGLD